MRLSRLQALAAAVVTAAALAGCGEEGDREPGGAGLTIDERRGTLGPIGLGSSLREVEARFGAGERADAGTTERTPLQGSLEELGLPWTTDPPPGGGGSTLLRYPDAVFKVAAARVVLFSIARAGVTTRGGVGIGDPLGRVRERYEGARCGIRNAGSDAPEYPYCVVTVAPRRFVWFGRDPIRSITVAAMGLG